jgi:nuclear GTP-binding protein
MEFYPLSLFSSFLVRYSLLLGPVRTVSQTQMTTFREELKNNQNKPYEFLLKSSKVPYSLLRDSTQEGRANLLEVEKFEDTFGKKSQRYLSRIPFVILPFVCFLIFPHLIILFFF